MIDLDTLVKQCPKCSGLGRTENQAGYQLWASHSELKDIFQVLETNKNLIEETPDQPYGVCEKCNGRGKILTHEGKNFIEFVRYWMNSK